MKIIRLVSLSSSPDIDIHPDSALILPGRPLFMPEWGEGWVASLHPSVKIGRLGKNIARKFASRYYDGISLSLRVSLREPAGLEGVLSGMDSSLVNGSWLPAEHASEDMRVQVAVSDETVAESVTGPIAQTVDEVIAKVSEYMTLKMGDVVMLPPVAGPIEIKEGARITAALDGESVIDLRIV